MAPADAASSDPHTMRCFEVWGGNDAVDNGVVMPGLDAWLYSRPYAGHAAGGDIHYVSTCAAGLLTRILIADVSGHGDAVAEAAGSLGSLMRRYVNYIDQTRLVRSLNEEFGAIAGAGGFATAAVATYLAPERRLTLSSAGHPTPLWYRARRRAWSLLRADGPAADGPANIPLGVARPTRYDRAEATLGAGDIVVIYTDALIDALQPDGRPLGEDGLLRIAGELDPAEPADLMKALLDRVQCTADAPDDVTILVMRRNALVPRPSIRNQIASNARMISRLAAGALPGRRNAPWPDAGPLARLATILHRVNPRWGA